MLATSINGRTLKILFNHVVHAEPITMPRVNGELVVVSHETTAQLFEGPSKDNEKFLWAATSFCSVWDNFNRSVGRELALRRLVEDAYYREVINREERGALYRLYFTRPKQQK